MTTSPASLADFVPEGTPNGDDYRFKPYTRTRAEDDAQRMGMGIRTGFDCLEAEDFRFHPGKVYVVAGRPGEGKTALMLELLMRHVEQRNGTPGAGPGVFVTYEETLLAIYLRLVLRQVGASAIDKGLDVPRIPRVFVHEWIRGKKPGHDGNAAQWRDLLDGAADVLDRHARDGRLVLIDGDSERGPVDELVAWLVRASADVAPGLVVLDYFQKIRAAAGGTFYSRRQEQLQDTADRIRRYAKGDAGGLPGSVPVPVLVGAQVNRKEGETEPPDLDRVREGDDLANDASGVITIASKADDDSVLQARLVKNRDGKRGATCALRFHRASGYIYEGPSGTNGARRSGTDLLAQKVGT